MPSFEYEPLVLFLKPKISYEEEDRRDIDGAGPSGIRVEEEQGDLGGGKDSPKREAIEETLE
jgi:hypothetical protein